MFAHRTDDESEYFCVHGHWPQTEYSKGQKEMQDSLENSAQGNNAS
jgi:ribonuclease I